MTSATATTAAEEAAAEYVATPAASTEARFEALAVAGARVVKPHAEWAFARFSLDVAMLAAGVALAATGAPSSPLVWSLAFPLLTLSLLYARGGYVRRLQAHLLDELRTVVGATVGAAMAVTTARVITSDAPFSSTQALRPWLFGIVCLVAGRAVLGWAEGRSRRRGEMLQPTLILGAGRVGQRVASRLLERPALGLKPVGFLDKEPLAEEDADIPVLGASWDLERVVHEHEVSHVIVTFSTAPDEVLLRLVNRCEELGVEVSLVPRLFEKMPERITVDHLGGLPLVTPRASNPRGWQFSIKYAVDRVVAAAFLLLLLPLFLVIGAAVLASTGRPVLFRQARIGLDGREFGMLKFRTMRGDPESGGEADADWAARQLGIVNGQPRIADRRTPLGSLLRRCSLDELPQLWNVLRGDMSIVGPRPERAHYARRFEESIYRYAERHRVKSGLTGWAQVNGLRGKTSLADRVEWDNYYIENWSLWLDLLIFLKTPAALCSRRAE